MRETPVISRERARADGIGGFGTACVENQVLRFEQDSRHKPNGPGSIMPQPNYSDPSDWRSLVILVGATLTILLALLAVGVLWARGSVSGDLRGLLPEPAAPPVFAALGPLAPATDAPINARWTYFGGEAGQRRVDRAIEEATEDMERISRDVARNRLRGELTPASGDVVEIKLSERGAVDLRLGDCPMIQAAPLGEWVDWRCRGEALRVQHELINGALVQRSRGKGTTIYRTFTVENDALTMNVRLDHERLPAAVQYGLKYAK